METAQRVFKQAKEERSGESQNPWADGQSTDGQSDWVLSGGPGQSGDGQESSSSDQASAADGGQPRDLEGDFQKSLEDYDGKIMDERAVIVASANRDAGERELPESSEGAGGSSAPGDEGAPGGESGNPGGATASGTSDIPTTMPPKNTTPGDYKPVQVASNVPPDIPSGDDDDVVARQLREAAMKEPDPELRKKLWDEYRKYKSGTQ